MKFALAVVLGVGAIWAAMPTAAAAIVLATAVVLASRALTVLAHDPASPRTLRPRDHAHWDGGLATVLALVALAVATTGATAGALVTGAVALALAGLRLRTRYVA